MRLDHAILNRPLDAGVVLEEHEWEQDYDPRGTWLVQTGELGKVNDYGVVSDGHGFTDSPDCEHISGGINSKGPRAVAIGRQANMLQWGFYAAPDRMTESGKKAFLNAIVYMKQFDGHKPLVKKSSRARSWLEQYVETVRELDSMDESSRDFYEGYLPKKFPASLIAEVGLDADALEEWRAANEEYFFNPARGDFQVDEDLARLGVSNRRPEFLDLLLVRLAADAEDELGLRLAGRYLGQHGKDAATAIAWIRANREWLFYSDTGGYRWFVDSNAKGAAASAVEAVVQTPR